MNDFTKEELQFIKNYMFGGSYSVTTKEMALIENKIISMIEKFNQECSHESDSFEPAYQCDKCGKYLCMGDFEDE